MPQASGSRSADGDARAEQLRKLLSPVVAAAGFDLEDLTVTAAGRRSLVRVVVDAEGGVDLDGVATVSRAASDALDTVPPGGAAFAGPYVLEVSSPGVDRPLTEPRHWRRSLGRLVAVTVDGRSLTGRLIAVTDAGIVLDVDGASHGVEWQALGPGRVRVEFTRADVPATGAAGEA
jgi:ribosome maturation factor RimP